MDLKNLPSGFTNLARPLAEEFPDCPTLAKMGEVCGDWQVAREAGVSVALALAYWRKAMVDKVNELGEPTKPGRSSKAFFAELETEDARRYIAGKLGLL